MFLEKLNNWAEFPFQIFVKDQAAEDLYLGNLIIWADLEVEEAGRPSMLVRGGIFGETSDFGRSGTMWEADYTQTSA